MWLSSPVSRDLAARMKEMPFTSVACNHMSWALKRGGFTYCNRLGPVTRLGFQSIQDIPTSPIEHIHQPVVASAYYDATVFSERHLSGPFRSCYRNWESANASYTFKSIEGHAFTGVIKTEDTLFRINIGITAM